MSPALSVRAALYRAAMHAMPKGDAAEACPHLAGVRIERVAAGGVNLVATDQTDLLIWLRDPDGFIGVDATVQIPRAFFDAARRGQRENGIAADDVRLEVSNGQARLNPGLSVLWPAEETGLPYIDWRPCLPAKAIKRPAPPVSPDALVRATAATEILARAGLISQLTFEPSEHGEVVVVNWGSVGFALMSAVEGAQPLPWRMPASSIISVAGPEARAS